MIFLHICHVIYLHLVRAAVIWLYRQVLFNSPITVHRSLYIFLLPMFNLRCFIPFSLLSLYKDYVCVCVFFIVLCKLTAAGVAHLLCCVQPSM